MKRPPMPDLKQFRLDLMAAWRFYDKADAWEGAPIDRLSVLTALSVLDYVLYGADYEIIGKLRQMTEVARDARENA